MQCWCFNLLSGTGLKLSWGSHQQLLKPARLFLELSRPFGCAKKPRTDTCVSPTVQHCHLPPWRFGLASLAQHVASDSMHRYDAWSYFGPHVMSNSASLSPLFLLQLDVVVLFCFFLLFMSRIQGVQRSGLGPARGNVKSLVTDCCGTLKHQEELLGCAWVSCWVEQQAEKMVCWLRSFGGIQSWVPHSLNVGQVFEPVPQCPQL